MDRHPDQKCSKPALKRSAAGSPVRSVRLPGDRVRPSIIGVECVQLFKGQPPITRVRTQTFYTCDLELRRCSSCFCSGTALPGCFVALLLLVLFAVCASFTVVLHSAYELWLCSGSSGLVIKTSKAINAQMYQDRIAYPQRV